jgi:hypothetical protein
MTATQLENPPTLEDLLEDLTTRLCDALAQGRDTRQIIAAIGNVIDTILDSQKDLQDE